MSTDRDTVVRLAQEAGAGMMMALRTADEQRWVGPLPLPVLERFAALAIADFLQRTGQYVTNDATRAAVVSGAVAAEREDFVAFLNAAANEAEKQAEACLADGRDDDAMANAGAAAYATALVGIFRARTGEQALQNLADLTKEIGQEL